MALIENLQREDLNPIEEARAFARLAREFGEKAGEIRAEGRQEPARRWRMRCACWSWTTSAGLARAGSNHGGHAKVLLSLRSHDEQS
jgi:ParB family chromosome partitioning protein